MAEALAGLHRVELIMGTAISVDIADDLPPSELTRLADEAFDWFRLVDARFSTYKADSDVSRLGRRERRLADCAPEAGAVNHCVNAGGDVRVRGRRAPGQPWRVGVRHPWQQTAVCWVVVGTDLAIATSGTYERGCHVVDPHRGVPARELRSVTVVGPDLGVADAYATAALAMGTGGLDWLSALDGHECAVVQDDGRCFRSAELPVV